MAANSIVPFDPADFLDDADAISCYEAQAASSGDTDHMAYAAVVVERAKERLRNGA